MSNSFVLQGGKPIAPETVIELRELVFGSAAVPVRCDWIQTAFIFNSAKEDCGYGLISPRNATRGLLSVVQGFILKNLLFKRAFHQNIGGSSTSDHLHPNEEQQISVLIISMTEILKQISDASVVTLVLPGEDSFVPHSVTYFQDNVTEKLYVFQLEPNCELEIFLRRNIHFFIGEGSPGTLLFLYSAVLTRSLGKIRSDLDNRNSATTSFAGNKEEGSLNIVTLLLTGRATPYIHNGVIHVGDEDNYAIPQYGILGRCKIGLLLWENGCKQAGTRQPGSRLKTPHLPIWITSYAGHYGVIFNTNHDLLRNYHAESRFDLIYYSCSGHQISMTIDNRGLHEPNPISLVRQKSETGSAISGNVSPEVKEESVSTPLQRLVQTKWEDAVIHFHSQQSVLRYLFSSGNEKA